MNATLGPGVWAGPSSPTEGTSLTRRRRRRGDESKAADSGGFVGDELLAVGAHLALFVLKPEGRWGQGQAAPRAEAQTLLKPRASEEDPSTAKACRSSGQGMRPGLPQGPLLTPASFGGP